MKKIIFERLTRKAKTLCKSYFTHSFVIFMAFTPVTMSAEIVIDSISKTNDILEIKWWIAGEEAQATSSVEVLSKGKTISPVETSLAPDPTQPVCYLFITDTSLSMKQQLQTAVSPLLNILIKEKPDHHVYRIGRFDVGLELLSPFSNEVTLLNPAIEKLTLKGRRTELFRSALQGLQAMQECKGYRHLLVVLSDGDAEDLPDAYSLDDVVNSAKQLNISIITFGFKDSIKLQNLRKLADETGGWHWLYRADEVQNLVKTFTQSTDSGGFIRIELDNLPVQTESLTLNLTLLNQQKLSTTVELDQPEILTQTEPLSTWQTWLKQQFPDVPLTAWVIGFWILMFLILLRLILFFIKRSKRIILTEAEPVENDPIIPLAALEADDKVFIMDKLSISIGALPDNDWQIDHPTVSRHQATIDYKDSVFYITDRGSTNPSQINGKSIQHGILQNGDMLQFGEWQGQFKIL